MCRTILAVMVLVAALTRADAAEPGGAAGIGSLRPSQVNGHLFDGFRHGAIRSWLHNATQIFDPRSAAEACLATAVYFEARSESLEGQLAVAMVILNRTKSDHYPSTVCGVVYQGAHRFNSCQFSFACDGKSDVPREHHAWDVARFVTAVVLAGGVKRNCERLPAVAGALNYHADYVQPRWSASLNRLTKIGRHIFYSQS